MDERLVDHYNTELRHLREMTGEFAREFPKIAGRLSIQDAKEICPDPYVERLLEGFAWLAARIHLKLDAEFPRFTQSLLETVYPHYLSPIPSMAVVRFDPEEADGALAPGVVVPRGTLLRSNLGKGERTSCTFQTAQAVRLLPLRVKEARYFTRDISELNLPEEHRGRAALPEEEEDPRCGFGHPWPSESGRRPGRFGGEHTPGRSKWLWRRFPRFLG